MTGRGAIARRYARALFDLGQETSGAEALLEELESFVATADESAELAKVLFTPIHPRAERRGVVGEIGERLELSGEVRACLGLLVDENRMGALREIRDALRDLVERAAGRMKARVTSARPLEEDEVERLRAALSQRTGRDVRLELDVDRELIGGVVVRAGDLLLDGSLRTQLDALRASLRKGAA